MLKKYLTSFDFATGYFLGKNDRKLGSHEHEACFSFLRRANSSELRATFFETCFINNLSETSTLTLRCFLKVMEQEGLFRNVDVVEIVKLDAKHGVKLRFDLNKITASEMFLVLNIVRLVQLFPLTIRNMFRFKWKHPDVDYHSCLLIAHCLVRTEEEVTLARYRNSNHLCAYVSFQYVRNKLKDAHKKIDEEIVPTGTYKKNQDYLVVPWCDFFTGYGHSLHRESRVVGGPVKYTKEIFESYLSKENYESFVNSKKSTPKAKEGEVHTW